MTFEVILTKDAKRDLEHLLDYIARHDTHKKALHVLHQIEKRLFSLCESPERGAYPDELLAVGMREYREIFFKPYRIIYRVQNKQVYIVMISDSRRDMQTLLQQRLLRP